MSLWILRDMIDELPRSLREQVDSYALFVQEAGPEVFRSLDVDPTPTQVDTLVFLAGLRRLWGLVDSQAWLLDNSLHLLARHDIKEIRVHSAVYSRNAQSYRRLKELRDDMMRELDDLDLSYIREVTTLTGLAERVVGGPHG